MDQMNLKKLKIWGRYKIRNLLRRDSWRCGPPFNKDKDGIVIVGPYYDIDTLYTKWFRVEFEDNEDINLEEGMTLDQLNNFKSIKPLITYAMTSEDKRKILDNLLDQDLLEEYIEMLIYLNTN